MQVAGPIGAGLGFAIGGAVGFAIDDFSGAAAGAAAGAKIGDKLENSLKSSGKSTRQNWKITKEGTDKIANHKSFGKISKSKSDGLWWSKDNAGHGGSAWKVFREAANGLEWVVDADQFGDFIFGKHKGDVGRHIPWRELGK